MPLTDTHAPAEEALTTTWREERLDVDPAATTYRARCRADETVSTAVVLTVAALHDCAATDLPPLLTAVDPDALVRLVTHAATATARTTFAYADCTVTVRSTGEITVTPDRRERPPSSPGASPFE